MADNDQGPDTVGPSGAAKDPAPSGPEQQKEVLRTTAEAAQSAFSKTHQAREHALSLSRAIIRTSANSIRATHRSDFALARQLLGEVSERLQELSGALQGHASVYYAGFVEDAQKEYVEAAATLAFVQMTRLPGLEELGVGAAPYLNGLAESVGELRRFILDSLRRDDFSRCDQLLDLMDEVYTILVSMDFPETITRGLRRNSDMVRGVLERTRGDLTVAFRQRRLEQRLSALEDSPAERSAGPDPT